MKQLSLLLLFSGTLMSVPPGVTEMWGQPPTITRSLRLDRLPKSDEVEKAAAAVHSDEIDEIRARLQRDADQYTVEMMNGNLSKEERDQAKWRLTNIQNHPYYTPRKTYVGSGGCLFEEGKRNY